MSSELSAHQPLYGWNLECLEWNGQPIIVRRRSCTSKTPTVYLHGILANADFWPGVLPSDFLDAGGCSVSLPRHSTRLAEIGFGFPGRRPPQPLTMTEFCEPILKVIDTFYPDSRVDLVGWSTGGFSALLTAATYPDRIRRVVSISGFARGVWSGALGRLQCLATSTATRWIVSRMLRAASQRPTLFERAMDQLCAGRRGRKIPEGSRSPLISEGLRNHDLDEVVGSMASIRGFDITEQLRSVKCPVLVMSGTKDPIIPHEEAEHLASNLQIHELYRLEDCGHLFFAEAGDETFGKMNEWLKAD